ncbi:amidase family protein [Fusarium austroafricanum]|uniref:Amidase family protein n=1 Tax=Fusarium austroafricanum TaxID=2364996 RepID=A0A8H4KBC9_9HYPO|nr:amidase family protein [Fusarium austroafricanum]
MMNGNLHRLLWPLALVALAVALLWRLPLSNSSLPRSVNLLTETASDLSALLNSGRITSAQLVEECLDRIYSHDKHGLRLNSVLNLVPRELLRSTAMGLDSKRRYDGAQQSDLFGIPILIKDHFATDPTLGLPTTGGAFALANVTAKQDATAIHQLREAGAIILGKTNLDELSGSKGHNLGSGWSKPGGKTRSAYTLGSPCGSSGGSAVAVSAGLVPVALGSETAGSVTCPASHAALFGFVPSGDLVSKHGMAPISTSFDRSGILSKSTADLVSVLGIIAQSNKPSAQEIASSNYRIDTALWADFRIGRADPDFFGKTHGVYHDETGEINMYKAVSEAIARMETLGAFVNMNASFPSAKLIPQEWEKMQRIMRHDMKSSFAKFCLEAHNSPVRDVPELVKYNKEHWVDALKQDGLAFPQGQEILEKSVEENMDKDEYYDAMSMLHESANTSGIEYAFKAHDVDFLVAPGWSWISVYSGITGMHDGLRM